MKPAILSALAGFAFSLLPLQAADRMPTIVTNPDAPAPSDGKPIYCYFKEGTITQKSKNKIEFDITLAGDVPNTFDRDLVVHYWVSFDIDANPQTGTASISYPGFGQDIGCHIIKPRGTARFTASDGEATIKGKRETLSISKLKVDGNKLSFELTSPVFGDYPQTKALLMAGTSRYVDGAESSSVTADQLPRGGSFTIQGN